MATTDLVSFAQATAHLKLATDDAERERDDIEAKLQQATALILIHIEREDNEWTGATDPTTDLEFALVQAAILELFGEIYRFRGDDADLPRENEAAGAFLRPNLRRKLHPLRRPSLA